MTAEAAHVAALHRFPVKGLSPERMPAVRLAAGAYVPGDRLFAIENGASGFDEGAPRHLPKTAFLMLMRHERLAALVTRYDPERQHFSARREGEVLVEASLATAEGRKAVEAFFASYCADGLRGDPRVRAAADGFRFTDSRIGYVSLLNLSSVRSLESRIGRPVDPLRFRANVAIEGWSAWAENGLLGRRLRVGDSVVEVTSTTERCAATEVDPSTGARDMAVVKALVRSFGHNLCGVYASVIAGGEVREGDAVTLLPADA